MFKHLTCAVCLGLLSLTSMTDGHESDFITYDWLIDCARKTSYTDHIPHFRRLFNTIKVRGLLECGCGYSTKYFMDHCDRVVSIEFMTPGTGDLWFNECLKLYRDCTNWVPLAYNIDHKDVSFNEACAYACSVHKDYALIDSGYLDSLDRYFKTQLHIAHEEGKEIDVAFVDPGVYTRGDMVTVLLENRVPIVIAHDTGSDLGSDVDEGYYAWFTIKKPSDYEKIYIPWGQGTTFWIHKNLPHVIESISTYRDMIIQAQAQAELSIDELKEIADRCQSLEIEI
jgi:hypothetical protein